jgi:hypothetical protein
MPYPFLLLHTKALKLPILSIENRHSLPFFRLPRQAEMADVPTRASISAPASAVAPHPPEAVASVATSVLAGASVSVGFSVGFSVAAGFLYFFSSAAFIQPLTPSSQSTNAQFSLQMHRASLTSTVLLFAT